MLCYSFDKKPSLFPSPEDIPGPGPYYTCLISMADLESFPQTMQRAQQLRGDSARNFGPTAKN